jgi:hypothetical protein
VPSREDRERGKGKLYWVSGVEIRFAGNSAPSWCIFSSCNSHTIRSSIGFQA